MAVSSKKSVGLSRKAVKLLREVIEHIKARPERFDMEDWGRTNGGSTPCNTSACIAGWAQVLSDPNPKRFYAMSKLDKKDDGGRLVRALASAHKVGGDALELTPVQRDRLFYEDGWPIAYGAPFQSALENSQSDVQVAIAVARIEHFIATDGKE